MKQEVDYREIVGNGDRDSGNPLSYLYDVISDQVQGVLETGEASGFAKLTCLIQSGKTGEAIKSIEEATRLEGEQDVLNVFRTNVCDSKAQEMYPGLSGSEVDMGYPEYNGGCHCRSRYVDATLFGARLAELAGDSETATELYSRANEVVQSRWYLTQSDRVSYISEGLDRIAKEERLKRRGMVGEKNE